MFLPKNTFMIVSKELIIACKNDKRGAFEKLYNACIPYVYSIVKRYISNNNDRKDVIQEIFAKVFKNLDSYKNEEGKFQYWLRKITVNECLMNLRTKTSLEIVALNTDFDTIDIEDIANQTITREEILKMLNKMPKKYKIVFMAYVIDGFSHKEIAYKMNITPETSRSQLNRSKKWIKDHIFSNNKFKAYGLL